MKLMMLAHAGHGADGLFAGLLHPLTGWDHLVAAVAIGVVGLTFSRRAPWVLPAMFLAGMVAGGCLALANVGLPGVEAGIACSILALGLVLLIGRLGPLWAAGAVAFAFAVFHGHAHLGATATPHGTTGYLIGLFLTTLSLHATGVLLGQAFLNSSRRRLVRALEATAGTAMAAVALLMLAGRV